jgi:DNA polymerase III epsilon subunit-like protein
MNEADIIIAHNGIKFDVKVMNGRFFKYGLDLPAPYQVIDTFQHAVKRFKLPSSGLNYIAKYLNLPQKKPTDFKLWVSCMKGDKEALTRMDEYCRQDVLVLEDVYLAMRKYIQPHPAVGFNIGSDISSCPTCGSEDLKKEGTYKTTVNEYDTYRCKCCGSISRSRKSNISKEDKQHILVSVPR